MFGPKNNKLGNSIERFDTIIGQSLRVEGNLIVSQAIRVDGYVNGNIFQADSETATVAVAEGAMVNGDIRASHVIISGKLTPIEITEPELAPVQLIVQSTQQITA